MPTFTAPVPDGPFTPGTGTPGQDAADLAAAVNELRAAGVPADVFRPAVAVTESYPRRQGGTNAAGWLVSGRAHVTAVPLNAGDTVTDFQVFTLTTALAGGSNQWCGLYDASRNLIGVTADAGATAWGGFSSKVFTLVSPHTVTAAGLYYVMLVVVATTMPSLTMTPGGSSALIGLDPVLCGYANTGLTNPASAPATFSAPTALPGISYLLAR